MTALKKETKKHKRECAADPEAADIQSLVLLFGLQNHFSVAHMDSMTVPL